MEFKELSITFHTNKLKECVEFYCKYFQSKIIFDSDWYVIIRLKNDENKPLDLSFQDLSKFKRDTFMGGVTLNLKTKDVDSCYQQMKQTDIKLFEEIADHEWGCRAFSVKDPIGNLIYVYSDREMSDKYKEAVKE